MREIHLMYMSSEHTHDPCIMVHWKEHHILYIHTNMMT